MSIDRWVDTEIVAHIYNGMLLSYKKKEREHIWFSTNEVNEPRAYFIQQKMSERERQILYIDTGIWNLERWYWWIYLQGSSGDTDIADRLMDTLGEGEGGMNWEKSMETHLLPYVNRWKVDFVVWHIELNSVLCDNLEGWDMEEDRRGIRRGGHTCGRFMFKYGKNQHNIVKQLSSTKKRKEKIS